jgi:hypothetical protein
MKYMDPPLLVLTLALLNAYPKSDSRVTFRPRKISGRVCEIAEGQDKALKNIREA